MKPALKRICIFIFFIAFHRPADAQVSIGIKGFINTVGAPMVQKQDFFSKSLEPAFNPGFSLVCEFDFSKKLAIQPEISFRQDRSHYLLHTAVTPTIHTSVINYIRMPVLLKLIQPEKWISFVFFVGPNFGYGLEIKSAETTNYRMSNNVIYSILDFEDYEVSRFDLAITLGFGLEKTIANRFRTCLDFRYDFGLNDIIQSSSNSFYNSGLTLGIGILIPLSQEAKKTEKPDPSGN
jgi:hypothetical protein